MATEIWKDITGFEGKYQVSTCGNVKALHWHNGKEKQLKTSIHCQGNYKSEYVELCKDGKGKPYIVSRLVYSTFNGPIPAGYQVDHKDNNQLNNNLDNLQLLTSSENNKKKFTDNPNKKLGCCLPMAKVICNQTKEVFESIRDCARKLNLYPANISRVLKGERKTANGFTFNYFNGSI